MSTGQSSCTFPHRCGMTTLTNFPTIKSSYNSDYQRSRSVAERNRCSNQINLFGFGTCPTNWIMRLKTLLFISAFLIKLSYRTRWHLSSPRIFSVFRSHVSDPYCRTNLTTTVKNSSLIDKQMSRLQMSHIGKCQSGILYARDHFI